MRAPRLRTALAVSGAVAIVLAAAGCAESKRNDPEAPKKDTLVFGVAGDPKVLDPSFASDGESLRVARQVFETLVQPEEGGAKIVPSLATSYTPDSTGLVWTFKLKTGVKFHDGTDFNAEAVCTNFNRWFNYAGLLQSPDVSSYWQDIFGGFAKNERTDLPASLFKSCTAKAADTAEVTITSVTSKFPAALALPSFSMSSPKALKDFEADKIGGTAENITYPKYATNPVGTGPYKFESWDTTNKVVKLSAYDGYHGKKAKIKNLHFKTISDLAARKQALEAGDIQGYDLVAPADVKPLTDAGFNVLTRPAFNILYLAINQSGNPALAKPEVRQAIAHAINKKNIVDSKYPPGSTPAINFHPSSLPGYNEGVTKYDYDVTKGKALLAQAGFPNGLTLKFHYPTEVTRPYMPAPKDIFELISADLKAIGITVEPIALKWSPDYLNATTSGKNHDLHLLGWTGDYADAYNFIGTFFDRPKDEWGYTNQPLFDQFKAADKEPDANKRAELYKALNAELLKFLPGVPIAHGPPSLVLGKDVTGVKASPLTNEQYSTAEYK
jgi:peptide/nickel transport system substrate-binding protein